MIIRAGEPVIGDAGQVLCRLAVDVSTGMAIEPGHFTEWTRPAIKAGDDVMKDGEFTRALVRLHEKHR